MNCSSYSLVASLALSALLAGCATTPRPDSADGKSKQRSVVPKARKEPAPQTDAVVERRVKAYAQFAEGVRSELNKESDEALAAFTQSAMADPSHEELVLEVAQRYLRLKQPEKAVEVLAAAAARPSASGLIHAVLGVAYAEAGKKDKAIAAHRTAIKKMPRSLLAYQNLTQLYLQNGQPKDALKVLEEAARQPGTESAFLIGLAELYSDYARLQTREADKVKPQVVEVLDRALKLASQNPIELQRIADQYKSAKEFTKAEEIYLKLLRRVPPLPAIRERLIDIYLRSGNKERAAEQLESIARDNPTNPNVYFLLGSLASEEKKYDLAVEHFERAIRLKPDFEQVYYDLAGVKVSADKAQQALEVLAKAREKFPPNFILEFYTAVAYSRLKNYSEAVKHFTEAEVLAKVNEPARLNNVFYFQIGSVLERKGDYAEAEKYFQKCLELSPNYAEALNYLGYMWAERGVKLTEARKLIEKAVEQEPKNAAFLDSMGWVLFKLNQPHEALTWLLKAIEHTEEVDPTLYDHLGDIHATLKQYDKAREAWQKSLKVESNEQIQKKLEAVPPNGRAKP